MPAIRPRAAAITAGRSSCSRSRSVTARAGTITCSRSSGYVPGGSAAWAAVPAATASGVACQGPAGASSSEPVHSRFATSSKLRWVASAIASCPR